MPRLPSAASSLVLLATVCALASSGVAAAGSAVGQDHQHSPYAGHGSDEVVSFTEDELQQLRNGEGMGFAKPAEMNGYPGPKHVLELATELSLTAEQTANVREIFDAMKAAAIETGERLIAAEKHLNDRFRHRHIDAESLATAVAEVARLRGELRTVHLAAHLTTRAALSDEQAASYDRLRGYTTDPSH
jgi:hypothetical protein